MVCMSAFFTAPFNMYANAGRLLPASAAARTVTRGAPLKRRSGREPHSRRRARRPDRWGAGTETNDGLL